MLNEVQLLLGHEIARIDALVAEDVVVLAWGRAISHRFALFRFPIEKAPFPKVTLLTVQRCAVAQVILVPVATVLVILPPAQLVAVRIQGLKAGVKVQHLPRGCHCIRSVGTCG